MLESDLVVIGAGPAGMAAAHTAAEAGLTVLLLDEQAQPGGQIYRNVERAVSVRGYMLGGDYAKGMELVRATGHSNIQHIKGAVVWQVERADSIAFTAEGESTFAKGRRLLIATGAIERAMPVPGWTLPGVMTAGAAQILLKQSGVVCENAVLAGSGPLLYLVAAQMCRAGAPPLALVETQNMADIFSSLRHGFGALRGWRYLAKGLGLLAEIRRAGVKRYTHVSDVEVEGDQRVDSISFVANGKRKNLECSTVLLHHGVIPNTQIARSMNIPHRWSLQQRAFVPEKDKWGRTCLPEVFIAGDGGGIGGAEAAALAGQIGALEISHDLGALTIEARDRTSAPLRRKLRRELAARPFIDHAYPPFAEALAPTDETVVCRCEEVTAGDIRRYASLGCQGPNQAKAFGRSGMGPCQGRYCGLAVSELLAAELGQTKDKVGYYRIRPPIKPVRLGELAVLPSFESSETNKDAAE